MRHEITFKNDITELPPETGGYRYRRFRKAGTCTLTCSCGYDSGPIPTTQPRHAASDHLGFDVTTSPSWQT